eukprot:12656984-Alexandrium_andersonii.AAC.1
MMCPAVLVRHPSRQTRAASCNYAHAGECPRTVQHRTCAILSCRHSPARKPAFEPWCYVDKRFQLARH